MLCVRLGGARWHVRSPGACVQLAVEVQSHVPPQNVTVEAPNEGSARSVGEDRSSTHGEGASTRLNRGEGQPAVLNRSEFATTKMDEDPMAAAAIMGFSRPITASGTAKML